MALRRLKKRGGAAFLSALRGRSLRTLRLVFSTPLAADDFVALDALGGVASVDDQVGFLHDALVVIVGMIGDNQHAIVLSQVVERCTGHLQVVFASASDLGEIRVVVADQG